MADPVQHLFVYGTLRSDYNHPAHSYIATYFSLIGKAHVRGKLYQGSEYPAGIPTQENLFITGELYAIKKAMEFETALKELDDYEGSYDRPGEPALFRRELINVLHNDTVVTAWIYWYNRDVSGKIWIRSGDILKTDH